MAREMKNSGIEWIGEIPAEWICDKVCRQFALIGSGTTPKSDNDSNYIGNIHWIQSGDINGGILHNTKNKVSNEVVEKYSALKVYKSPFIVIAMYGASIGNISSSIIDGCVNQACCVLSEGHMNIKYAFYTLKSAKDYLIYNGVGGGQPNISQDIVKQLRLPVPSIREQEMIVDYLDKKCAEIDAVIEKTKATIEEYKKLKQSVITEAVTKGIRGERPMKDSGIEWIGEIPAEWDVSAIKKHFDVYSGATPKSEHQEFWDGDILWITPADYKTEDKYIKGGKRTITIEGYESCGTTLVPKNSIIFSKRAPIGSVAISDKPLCTNQGCLACVDKGENSVLYYYFSMSAFTEIFELFGSGTTFKEISFDSFSAFRLPHPSYEEQQEIADYLDKKCAEIDTIIAKKTALLDEMESYKKSVIYEYVTGKKEVR